MFLFAVGGLVYDGLAHDFLTNIFMFLNVENNFFFIVLLIL